MRAESTINMGLFGILHSTAMVKDKEAAMRSYLSGISARNTLPAGRQGFSIAYSGFKLIGRIFKVFSKKKVLSLFTICIFLLSGCSKEEISETKDSAILALGSTPFEENPHLAAKGLGDLVVGIPSYQNGNVDSRVFYIDAERKIKWDRYFGTKKDDYLQKIYIDKKGNILLAGMTYEFRDSQTQTIIKRELLYLHYLSPEGETIWEKVVPANYGNISWSDSEVLDVQEDALGNLLISASYGNEFNLNGNLTQENYGTLVIVNSKGELLDLYILGRNGYRKSFTTNNGYGAFYISYNGAGLIEFKRNDAYRIPEDSPAPIPGETKWTWEDPTSPVLGVWGKTKTPGDMQFVVVKKEEITLFKYAHGGELTSEKLDLIDDLGSSYPVAVASGSNHFLYADSNGEIFVLNESLDLINRFKTSWDIIDLTALSNGNIAVAFRKGSLIHIMIYDSNGQAVD